MANDSLTQVISVYAINSLSVFITPILYIGLLVAARILALPEQTDRGEVSVTVWVGLGLIVGYFGYTEGRMKTGFFRPARFPAR